MGIIITRDIFRNLLIVMVLTMIFFSCKNDNNTKVKSKKPALEVQKWKLKRAVDFGAYEALSVAKFKHMLFISDTVNNVVLRYNLNNDSIATIINNKIGYLNLSFSRMMMASLEDDSLYVYRGGADLYSLKTTLDIDRPINYFAKKISDYVVVEQSNNRLIRTIDGQSSYVGSYGSGKGQFNNPSMALIHKQSILVTDTGNRRIQVLDYSGEYVKDFGSDQLLSPTSISIDGQQVYVCDTERKEILVYTIDGAYQYSFKSEFKNPTSVFVDGGLLCVSDLFEKDVFIFEKI